MIPTPRLLLATLLAFVAVAAFADRSITLDNALGLDDCANGMDTRPFDQTVAYTAVIDDDRTTISLAVPLGNADCESGVDVAASVSRRIGSEDLHLLVAASNAYSDVFAIGRGPMVGIGAGARIGRLHVRGILNGAQALSLDPSFADDTVPDFLNEQTTVHLSAGLGILGFDLSAAIKCPTADWSIDGCHEEGAIGRTFGLSDRLGVYVEARGINYETANGGDFRAVASAGVTLRL